MLLITLKADTNVIEKQNGLDWTKKLPAIFFH